MATTRIGHPQQAVDRRVRRVRLAIRAGVGLGQFWGAAGEGEIVQGGQDDCGVPFAGRGRFDGPECVRRLAQGAGDALVQR
jgi:hypothetical protein